MKALERDEMLIRIDQKVQDSLPKIEKHLEKINGHLDDHSKRITTIEVKARVSKKAITGYISGAGIAIAALIRSFLNG